LGEGNNRIPTIHLKDLVKFVIKVAENPPEGSPYLLAIDEAENRTQRAIIQAISSGIGSGKIVSVKESPLIESPDRYLIDLNMRSSKVLVGTA
jgi:nucleoside-diphosphate-sugar epimerase